MRVTVVAGSDLTCDPSFWDFDVLPSGTAWFAGGCGARLRADPRGKVDDFRAPWKSVRFNAYGNVFASCPGTATFWGIWARSETEAYVVGDTRCGTDPNSIWYRPLEKFDGARWQSTNVAFGAGPHEGIPWELSGNAHELYTLVEGDDWHGPPECGLYRFSKGKWGKAELSCPRPKQPTDRVMLLTSVDVTADGSLWVAGRVLANGQPQSGMVWSRRKAEAAWTETAVDDLALHSVSVAADGSVWAAGRSLWRRNDSSFERVTKAEQAVDAFWPESSKRVFLVRGGKPFVFIEGRELPIPIEASDDSLQRIHGSGKHVWAASRSQAWYLAAADATGAVATLTVNEPTSADYPKTP